ncbi:hypothetical protein RRG08_012300 [Elysia crispata]|uniref:Uncharacterized protein n=1 Tax=Elysia crispata TaxID=231223 RepID=A0AAE1ECS3_9GAST|nr:hypothetical protein RRG08_012300 [Elysia crispata]
MAGIGGSTVACWMVHVAIVLLGFGLVRDVLGSPSLILCFLSRLRLLVLVSSSSSFPPPQTLTLRHPISPFFH